MKKYLCIHGHFYQPPREDPWLGAILPEGSAAPAQNWNQRITRESYAPMARARRLDAKGRIVQVMNCYEWMSFNVGPTLFSWLEEADPGTARLMIEADAKSLARLGHGNAMAQVYHHQILPLASPLDKELEVAWAVDDFTARFGRAPEGMWLAETAVDTDTLEVLAKHGLAFTVLAPGQAAATAPLGGHDWTDLAREPLDIAQPYLARLPSGRSISVFFYDGPLSQAVAFERLLADGETFWNRLSRASRPGITALATDGETYGHHFTFGEMALAFVLDQARSGRDGLALTNFAAYLAANPPTRQVRLHEPSAWSCAHGVERWRSDCGCTTGGHPGWHQRWRAPLRQALQLGKSMLDEHFFHTGGTCFADPMLALVEYGRVLAGGQDLESFGRTHLRSGLDEAGVQTAWKLLAMQQYGLASLASCAWFFDEVSRIEPVNALTFALRAAELASRTGGPDIEARLLPILKSAASNLPEYGDAARIWADLVKARLESPASLVAQGLLTLWGQDGLPDPGAVGHAQWPGVRVEIAPTAQAAGELTGTARIRWSLESGTDECAFAWKLPATGDALACPVQVTDASGLVETFLARNLPVNKRQALADAWVTRRDEALWVLRRDAALAGCHLVTELQEAQRTLTLAPRWAGLWSGLAWAYVWGLELPQKRLELLLLFLHEAWPGQEEPKDLAGRIAARTLEEISSPRPDWPGLAGMVERVRALGLPEDWWEVQNRLWDERDTLGQGRGLAGLLGFAQ